jgi:uncharacterized membrane protein YphA (DoxX/SURF4 family)
VFMMASGGIAELMHVPGTMAFMRQLGYPDYFVNIIGTWKLLGSIALLVPGFPRLKEWAYAGMFFNMTGAAISHIVMRSESWHVVVTSLTAVLVIVSWALRPPGRRLGNILPAGNR